MKLKGTFPHAARPDVSDIAKIAARVVEGIGDGFSTIGGKYPFTKRERELAMEHSLHHRWFRRRADGPVGPTWIWFPLKRS